MVGQNVRIASFKSGFNLLKHKTAVKIPGETVSVKCDTVNKSTVSHFKEKITEGTVHEQWPLVYIIFDCCGQIQTHTLIKTEKICIKNQLVGEHFAKA